MCWGALPFAIQRLLPVMDPLTIVWLRFTTAALWVWLWPVENAKGHSTASCDWRELLLLVIAVLGLGGNFVLFNFSLGYLSAAASQIIAQVGPMLLLLGSIFVLKESLRGVQIAGVLALVTGLGLFFNERLANLFHTGDGYALGILLGFSGAVSWSLYGLAQKTLLRKISPQRIMRVIYACCALLLLPFASPGTVLQLNPFQVGCLVFCCLNTLIAYGAFAKAMARWHAAKVSAVVTMTPLFTLAFAALFHLYQPELFPFDPISLLSYGGALVVVLGALLITVGPLLHMPQRRLS